jgi:hypothetical protein
MMPLDVGANSFVKGLGVAANSSVVIGLNGAYTTFQATIGLDSSAPSGGSVVFKVLADHTTIYTSPTMTSTSGARQINLNVAGHQVLDLVVTAAGSSTDGDFADWGNAQLTPRKVISISSLPHQVSGPAIGLDMNQLGGPIALNGLTYQQGIGGFAGTQVSIVLNGRYAKFTATIGVDSLIGAQGSVTFRIQADGRTIYRSSLMTATSPAKSISINVKRVKKLKLIINPGSQTTSYQDDADWGLAALHL